MLQAVSRCPECGAECRTCDVQALLSGATVGFSTTQAGSTPLPITMYVGASFECDLCGESFKSFGKPRTAEASIDIG